MCVKKGVGGLPFFIRMQYGIKIILWCKLQIFYLCRRKRRASLPKIPVYISLAGKLTVIYFSNNQAADMTGFTVFLALNVAAMLSVQDASFLHQVMLKSSPGMHFDAT